MVKSHATIASIPNLVFTETLFISKRSLHYYRIFFFAAYLAALTYNSAIDGFFDNFKYLTMWGMNFTGVFTLIMIISYYVKLSKRWKRTAYLLFEAAFAYELVITGFFWLFIYPHLKDKYEDDQLAWYNTIYLHGFVLFQVYFEFSFNTILIKFSDMIHIIIAGLCYVFVNYFYTTIVAPVYPILTYKDKGSYIYISLALVGMVLHFLYGVGLGSLYKGKQIKNLESRMVKSLKS